MHWIKASAKCINVNVLTFISDNVFSLICSDRSLKCSDPLSVCKRILQQHISNYKSTHILSCIDRKTGAGRGETLRPGLEEMVAVFFAQLTDFLSAWSLRVQMAAFAQML